ncbi:MAG: hypothetical protein HY244_06050 [Rhizobiales bacterium]|nr:hypothetical protein [Hyphomicrobiales bacterium]
MLRFLGVAGTLALASALLLPATAHASERTLPMRFALRLQGPADVCGATCKTLISAAGAITADTARDFISFARGRDLTGATVVLDSDGGSVHGAIALGREIRRRGLAATIGRTVDLESPAEQGPQRAALSPRADCESMCAFVLLGGVQRTVPREARVLVHQIWLGDRRDDPTAANYSAEDLVLVQRDIGKLAQYTADMGATIDLLDLALRIPPWEPMHALTRDEMRRARLATEEIDGPAAPAVAASRPAMSQPTPRMTDGARMSASPISEKRWAVIDRAGVATLARRHPLTVEGDTIGSFDLMLSCGGAGSFNISYDERRYGGDHAALPNRLSAVTLRLGDKQAPFKLEFSERRGTPDELVSRAAGTIPAALIDGFAAVGNHSVVIETRSEGQVTTIRLGNTGAQQNLPRLAASCGKAAGDRAELTVRKIGGLAAAQ